MIEHADWTGHVTAHAEEGERLTHSLDWTGHSTVSVDASRKWDKDAWIGPGILGVVALYLGGVWWLTGWIGVGAGAAHVPSGHTVPRLWVAVRHRMGHCGTDDTVRAIALPASAGVGRLIIR